MQTIEHQLSVEWAALMQSTVAAMVEHERKAFELEGRAAAERREIENKRRHLGSVIATISTAEHLPPSVTPYRLSDDATKIIGEVQDGTTA